MKPADLDITRAASAASGAKRMIPKDDQCRCTCGSMLARMVRDGLELKCRKCKSLILISHEDLIAMYRQLNFQPPVAPKSEPKR